MHSSDEINGTNIVNVLLFAAKCNFQALLGKEVEWKKFGYSFIQFLLKSCSLILKDDLQKEAIILLKELFGYLLLCLMPISCKDLENFVFNIFGNCHYQLNFSVAFRITYRKYQITLLMPIFGNSPCCNLQTQN